METTQNIRDFEIICKKGNYKELVEFLDFYPNFPLTCLNYEPLTNVVKYGHNKMLKYMLPLLSYETKEVLFNVACEECNGKAAKILFEKNMLINPYRVMFNIFKKNCYELFLFIMKRFNITSEIIDMCIDECHSYKIFTYLFENNVLSNIEQHYKRIFINCCLFNNLRLIKNLIELTDNLDLKQGLNLSIERNYFNIVVYLTDKYDIIPDMEYLYDCAQQGYFEIFKYIYVKYNLTMPFDLYQKVFLSGNTEFILWYIGRFNYDIKEGFISLCLSNNPDVVEWAINREENIEITPSIIELCVSKLCFKVADFLLLYSDLKLIDTSIIKNMTPENILKVLQYYDKYLLAYDFETNQDLFDIGVRKDNYNLVKYLKEKYPDIKFTSPDENNTYDIVNYWTQFKNNVSIIYDPSSKKYMAIKPLFAFEK